MPRFLPRLPAALRGYPGFIELHTDLFVWISYPAPLSFHLRQVKSYILRNQDVAFSYLITLYRASYPVTIWQVKVSGIYKNHIIKMCFFNSLRGY